MGPQAGVLAVGADDDAAHRGGERAPVCAHDCEISSPMRRAATGACAPALEASAVNPATRTTAARAVRIDSRFMEEGIN